MTCIVGLVDKGKVYIGGDSAGTSGYYLFSRADEKVFKKEEFIFGFTTSFRMGNLIRYKLNIPKRTENQETDNYLYTDFIDSIINCFKQNNYASINNNVVEGGTFLFGYRGNLYRVEDDFQLAKGVLNYDSCGCGFDIARGCLYGLSNIKMKPEDKILKSLEAAEQFSSGVRRPFNIVSI